MPVFIYHPLNTIGKQLKDAYEEDGFIYTARAQLEMMIKDKMSKAGIEVTPQFYCHLGPMAYQSLYDMVDKNIQLDPDKPMHKQILNTFKMKKPWAFVKLNNGPDMKCVIGYCDSDPSTPFLMSNVQMAQEGIIQTSFVPR